MEGCPIDRFFNHRDRNTLQVHVLSDVDETNGTRVILKNLTTACLVARSGRR